MKLKTFHHNSQLLVSCMDNSIKLYYTDSQFKEKLSFYGHSLPVRDFDLSSDDQLMASISADKSIRIWDTDFGNCRKIINKAHDIGVSSIRIMRDSHYAITAGKDDFVKFWDLDTFELVMRFESEMGQQIKNLAFSSIGDLICCAGSNKMIRVFE